MPSLRLFLLLRLTRRKQSWRSVVTKVHCFIPRKFWNNLIQMGSFSSNRFSQSISLKENSACGVGNTVHLKKALVKYAAILVNLWKFCISTGCAKNCGQFFYNKTSSRSGYIQICVENIGEKPMLQL